MHILHTSEGRAVYLAEHMTMHAKRVIKKVEKKSDYSESYFYEVDILKKLKHKNIPRIYDAWEDEFYYYMVEEYIEGEELYEFIKREGPLVEEQAIQIGIQLSNIIDILHSNKPYPILFLDIHPKNIIISEGEIFLIDFGSSMYMCADERTLITGTPGFAAPEHRTRDEIGIWTDIYGIGSLLFFMVTGQIIRDYNNDILKLNKSSHKFKEIVLRCLDNDREFRFRDTKKLVCHLSAVVYDNNKENKTENKIGNKPQIISITGIDKNVGVTYFCFKMCIYLHELGYKVIYMEDNDSNDVRNFSRLHSDCTYSGGIFMYKELEMIPQYDGFVDLSFDKDIIIKDKGVYKSDVENEEFQILISGSSEWDIAKFEDYYKSYNNIDAVVFNMCNEEDFRYVKKYVTYVGDMYYMPNGSRKLNDNDRAIFSNLLKEKVNCDAVEKKTSKRRLFNTTIFKKKC